MRGRFEFSLARGVALSTSGADSGEVNFPQAKGGTSPTLGPTVAPKSDTIPNVQKRERHDLVVESAMISWLKLFTLGGVLTGASDAFVSKPCGCCDLRDPSHLRWEHQ